MADSLNSQSTATRAVHFGCQSRAVSGSSHQSARSSSESENSIKSGRDRRRDGKQRMLATISELRGRVNHLEAQVNFYRALVGELAPQASQAPSAVIFDLFDDTDTVAASTQTEISVPHGQADVFVTAADLHQLCATTAVRDVTAASTDCADAAAGVMAPCANSVHLPDPANTGMKCAHPEPLRQSADSAGLQCAHPEPLLSPVVHIGVGSSLTTPKEPSTSCTTREFSGGSPSAFACEKHPGAEAVASAAPGLVDGANRHAGHEAPGSSNPGSQASPAFAFNDLSKKSAFEGCDDNSDKTQCGRFATVPQCGPCATVHNNSSQQPTFTATNSCDVEQSLKDLNSHHIANMCEPPPPLDLAEPTEQATPVLFDANTEMLAVGGELSSFEDFNSQHLARFGAEAGASAAEATYDFSAGADKTEPFDAHEDISAISGRTQYGPLPRVFDVNGVGLIAGSDVFSPGSEAVASEAADVGNSHGVTNGQNLQDFTSHHLANFAGHDMSLGHANSQNLANTCVDTSSKQVNDGTQADMLADASLKHFNSQSLANTCVDSRTFTTSSCSEESIGTDTHGAGDASTSAIVAIPGTELSDFNSQTLANSDEPLCHEHVVPQQTQTVLPDAAAQHPVGSPEAIQECMRQLQISFTTLQQQQARMSQYMR